MPKSVFSDSYRLLLELLRQTRTDAGVSQSELARRLGRPQPFISYVESGERRVDVIEFYAIMKALGADPERKFSEFVRQLPTRVEI
ncbi:MAG TPA: helix-turn-helix transcriptional regulator [Allosphingosinicella sp.]|nr:helix-turn-helix transcriptional regulator [Allosphingosinicella sp.]